MSLPTELTTSPPQEWDESIEKILSELGDEAQINAFLHKKANDYYLSKTFEDKTVVFVLQNGLKTYMKYKTSYPKPVVDYKFMRDDIIKIYKEGFTH